MLSHTSWPPSKLLVAGWLPPSPPGCSLLPTSFPPSSTSLLYPHGSGSTTALCSEFPGLFLLLSCLQQTRMMSPKGTCAVCPGQAGNGCSSSSPLHQHLSNHSHHAGLLLQWYQSCFSKIQLLATLYPLGSAWQGLEAPRISSCVPVPSLFLNKRDISSAPPGWKLSFLSGELLSVTPRSQEALGIKNPTN